MASWAVLDEQTVWISPLATGVHGRLQRACARARGEGLAPTVQGTLPLDALRGTVECPRGHRLRVERDGR